MLKFQFGYGNCYFSSCVCFWLIFGVEGVLLLDLIPSIACPFWVQRKFLVLIHSDGDRGKIYVLSWSTVWHVIRAFVSSSVSCFWQFVGLNMTLFTVLVIGAWTWKHKLLLCAPHNFWIERSSSLHIHFNATPRSTRWCFMLASGSNISSFWMCVKISSLVPCRSSATLPWSVKNGIAFLLFEVEK